MKRRYNKTKENNKEEYKSPEYCIQCGMCKVHCPSFQASKDEKLSPRGRAFIVKNKIDPDLNFYDCTLCGACKDSCYIKVATPLIKVREDLIKKGIQTEANKKMIENIRKYGNPFGKIEKGKVPKELYCC